MRVLIVSASKYPNNSAEAARLRYLAELFAVDNEVTIVSRGKAKTEPTDGIRHISVSNRKLLAGNIVMRALDYWLFTEQVKNYLKGEKKYDAIVFCALPTATLRYLIKHAKQNKIRLIHDAVEWYSAEEFKFGKLDRLYRKKELWMRKLLPGNCYVIAISRYLQKYFQDIGNPCVYVPSMIDTYGIKYEEKQVTDKIKIVYAGTPLKKDYLSVALDGIAMLEPQKIEKLEITIMGISREQAEKNGITTQTIKKLGNALRFLGRVPREEVFEKLQEANFAILLRPAEQRYAKAGFPTKVPESMAAGTPMICNFTSDLADFLEDGKNCVRVADCTAEAMAESMNNVLSYNAEELSMLSCSARDTAQKCFEYRLYVESVRKILQ